MRAGLYVILVAASAIASPAHAAELAYLRVSDGTAVPIFAVVPVADAGPGEQFGILSAGAIVTLDAALLGAPWVPVTTTIREAGRARAVAGFVESARLERVAPLSFANGVPHDGRCEDPRRSQYLDWSGGRGEMQAPGIPQGYGGNFVTVVVPYQSSPPPALVAYAGGIARPDYQVVISLDPGRLCTKRDGNPGIAGTFAVQVGGGEWSSSAVCCAATAGAF